MEQITVFAIIDSPAPHLEEVQEAVLTLARLSAAEPGCLRYDVHLSVKTPARLILTELWADAAALDRHRGTDHIAAFRAVLADTGATIWASPCTALT